MLLFVMMEVIVIASLMYWHLALSLLLVFFASRFCSVLAIAWFGLVRVCETNEGSSVVGYSAKRIVQPA